VQRIFNRNKIQDSSLTADNVLNILIHRSPFCVVTFTSYKLSKWSSFNDLLCVSHSSSSFNSDTSHTGSVLAATVVMRFCRTWRFCCFDESDYSITVQWMTLSIVGVSDVYCNFVLHSEP